MKNNNDYDDDELEASVSNSNSQVQLKEQEEEKIEIGNEESKAVCYLRSLLVLVLLVVAAGVSTAVYLYSSNNEEEDFETEYYDHAHKVVEAFRSNAALRFGALKSLAVSIASNARAAGEVWPNVTVPDHARNFEYALKLGKFLSLTLFPIVTGENLRGYEAYTVENQGWFNQSLVYREQRLPDDYDDTDYMANIEFIDTAIFRGNEMNPRQEIRDYVFDLTADGIVPVNASNGPFYPWWQCAPPFPMHSAVNYNAGSYPTRKPNIDAIVATEEPLVTTAWDYADLENPATRGKKAALNIFLDYNADYEDGPASDIYVPIFETLEDENGMELSPDERNMVGFLASAVLWQVYFENVLPENAQGVIAILESRCGGQDEAGLQFTYQLNGAKASYIGQTDLHEPKYDDMVVSTGFGAFLQSDRDPATLLPEECMYNVRVYPSSELEDSYTTSTPIVFTVVVVAVFLFATITFFIYDFLVEKRQTVVMEKAVQSTTVVNTLFPATVRDRLHQNAASTRAGTHDKKHQFSQGVNHDEDDAKGDIVADHYENCTVFFADLAGFTAWSSTRTPKDVFSLLETLYAEFDAIAKRRGVFKVETIGDCYLAITGVPNPQKKHALIMARFAFECLTTMNEIIHSKLVHSLGADTASLQLRVGMHSGQVTAGVLRGDRARFQLFGDTVNTASRMESHGAPGKIQASKATADLLVKGGKGSWLTPREGGVQAKGKGELETFWVNPTADRTATESLVSRNTDEDDKECAVTPVTSTEC